MSIYLGIMLHKKVQNGKNFGTTEIFNPRGSFSCGFIDARQKLHSPVDKRDISHKEIRDHTWKRKMRSNKKSHVKIIACKIIIIQVVSVYFVNIIPTLNCNIIKCLKYLFFFLLINFISIIKYFYDVFKNGRLSKIYRRLYSNASSQDRHGLLWSFFAKTYKKNIHILTHTRTHIINKNAFYSSRKKSDSCNFKLSSIKIN